MNTCYIQLIMVKKKKQKKTNLPCSKFYTNCALTLGTEIVSCKAIQQVGFANPRISDKNNCKRNKKRRSQF